MSTDKHPKSIQYISKFPIIFPLYFHYFSISFTFYLYFIFAHILTYLVHFEIKCQELQIQHIKITISVGICIFNRKLIYTDFIKACFLIKFMRCMCHHSAGNCDVYPANPAVPQAIN